ncbi:MAG: tRNA-dihydrouridine synthase, partial [Paludibacteraceae bacterium]|nr:tRNA-dihydrouridine synthase [Paludibacteraceae bacterium]
YLIGSHVKAAANLRNTKLKVVPVGYILVGGGKVSAVERVSGTQPIPATETEIIVNTALAGQLLGMQYIYLEAGSGAKNRVPDSVITAVKNAIRIPLIVGGGIKTSEELQSVSAAGADIAVIGNALETNPELYMELTVEGTSS